MGTTYEDFKEYALYPSLYEIIDRAFPTMEFQRRGNRWESKRHLDGSTDSQRKAITYVYSNAKFCAQDQAQDKRKGLIDLYMSLNGKDFITALSELSELCGLSLPESSPQERIRYEEIQNNREAANEAFKAALWCGSAEAAVVLNYLRNARKWTDEEIRKAELGLITPDVIKSLNDSSSYRQEGVGTTHRLTIPYRNGSRLFGFKFRVVEDIPDAPKYLNTYGLNKSRGFFGIASDVKDLLIVEGELDALHAKVKGASNVAATTGGRATETQIADAVKRGVERFTLLFDNDSRGKEFIKPTIEAIQGTGASIYVAALPAGVKDTDEYFTAHTLEDFNTEVIAEAQSYTTYLFRSIVDKYIEREKAEGHTTIKDREDFFKDIERLLNSRYIKPYERQDIYKLLGEPSIQQNLNYKITDFMEWAEGNYSREQAAMRADKVKAAAESIEKAVREGRTDEALKLMHETAEEQDTERKGAEYSEVFGTATPEEYSSYLAEVKEGIPTGYVFEEGSHREPLTLNTGLTFICAYRGHGKTSFLNNLAINEAKRNLTLKNGKTVLYFSYEVDKRRLMIDLLNTFVNDARISSNPSNSIQAYFKGYGDRYFSREHRTETYSNFIRKKDIFLKEYLSSGALRIVEESYKVEELLNAIKWYITQHSVSVIFIDYAQLIYSENYSRLRTEEIKRIVADIKTFANKEGIPFVMAAQFNREVDSPLGVDTKNIGEGGDYERIADTAIGLFNLKELHPLIKNREEEREVKKMLEDLGVETGESLRPVEGKIFVKLMKKRYGYYPLSCIMEWEGRTKYIRQNAPDEVFKEPEEQDLPFEAADSTPSPF